MLSELCGKFCLHKSLSHAQKHFCGRNCGCSRDLTNAFFCLFFFVLAFFWVLYLVSARRILTTGLHPRRKLSLMNSWIQKPEHFWPSIVTQKWTKLLRDVVYTKWKVPLIPELKFSKISRKNWSRQRKTNKQNPQNFAF